MALGLDRAANQAKKEVCEKRHQLRMVCSLASHMKRGAILVLVSYFSHWLPFRSRGTN